MEDNNYALEMRNISKDFFGVYALKNVSFHVKKGEIHALCGENGAGKSTLMKILSGVWRCGEYSGDILINGEVKKFNHVSDAEKAGIGIIYQELNLIEVMDIAENIFLNAWPVKNGIIDYNTMYYEAAKLCRELGIHVPPRKKVRELGIGVQQMVEIARALAKKIDILVLDEPTASLTENEVEILLKFLAQLRERGVTCIYISHKLSEVFRVCDRITVIRDGETVGTCGISDVNEDQLIKMMVGRELTDRFPSGKHEIGEPILEVENYSVYDWAGKKVLSDISFEVRQGEILGISGLMGAGRTELALSLFGAFGARREGKVKLYGKQVHIKKPEDAVREYMALVTEDRKGQGLLLSRSISDNIVMASLKKLSRFGVIDMNQQQMYAEKYAKETGVKAASLQQEVKKLSGGNQQKVVIAKWLMTGPKILFLDEPTRGIDVGAKYEIYSIMLELVQQGYSIVMISSELPEILGMSDEVLVMREGKISGKLHKEEATQERIMHLATAAGGNGNGEK